MQPKRPAPAPDRTAGPSAGPLSSAGKRTLSELRLAHLFLSPSLMTLVLVTLFPILYALAMSLYAYDGEHRQGFAGLANYGRQLTSGDFWQAVNATLVFTVCSVALELLIGLGFALIMNRASGRTWIRSAILVPWVIPTVISAQVWAFMFNIIPGFINHYVPLVPQDFSWLGQRFVPMIAIVIADVWKTAPFVALLLLTGLQTIPQELHDSARIDGASAWQRFRHITVPLLKPSILVALLFRTVDALRVYDLPKIMTNGSFGTETLSMLVRRFVVETPNTGIASTLSTLTFVLVFGAGLLFVSVLGRDLAAGAQVRR